MRSLTLVSLPSVSAVFIIVVHFMWMEVSFTGDGRDDSADKHRHSQK